MKPFVIHDLEQRSPAWFAVRLGKLTGSCAADVLATIKSGEAAARRDLRLRLVVERLTGQSQEDGFVSKDMQRGTDLEPAAFAAYEALTGRMASRVGFVSLPTVAAGCSPDGVVDDFETLLSLKCPKSSTQIGYHRAGKMPAAYVPQMLHELWITGAKFYDFLSFDDRLPGPLATFFVRVPRDEQAVLDYADKAKAFLQEVEREYEAVATLANLRGQLEVA